MQQFHIFHNIMTPYFSCIHLYRRYCYVVPWSCNTLVELRSPGARGQAHNNFPARPLTRVVDEENKDSRRQPGYTGNKAGTGKLGGERDRHRVHLVT